MSRLASASAITALVAGVTIAGGLFVARVRKKKDKTPEEEEPIDDRIPRQVHLTPDEEEVSKKRILTRGTITIAHASVTGTCKALAQELYDSLATTLAVELCTVDEFDWWDELLNNEETVKSKESPPIVILILPTDSNGTWPTSASSLQTALQDLRHDWRVEKQPLRASELRVAVFGMGSSAYDESTMGQPAKEAYREFRALGAKTIGVVGVGDNAVGNHAREAFGTWTDDIVSRIQKMLTPSTSCGCGSAPSDGCCQSHTESHSEEKEVVQEDYYDDDDEEEEEHGEPEVMDLEDMGDSMMEEKKTNEVREMVTPAQAASLKKEGYKLIGTHSAVKLCRWTKHQLRGRGGCYKHTFYGITSYQCMEATPSLACANKCTYFILSFQLIASCVTNSRMLALQHYAGVFCWRHHKNPVGKEWRWKTDDPYFIVDQAVKTHVSMIKEAKGIPGVQMDRWKEAHTVRHCALSLVGEPIMYPRIDELLGDLHRRKISTFLVTNGQHPQSIETLRPITQLYVSVDAPTPESLIAIDRPLFNDAWDRLKLSLSSLKQKGQRTVARLTVVKGWNSDEVEGYAKLIALGHVSLVEVKGVTFCGKSDASNLNMSNTPWHHEVVALTQNLQKELAKLRQEATDDPPPEYGLACEHKHSCSVLLARVDQFSEVKPATGELIWKTWIDYEKFHELAARNAQDPSFAFAVEDYTAETPGWALFGAAEEGFDPTDTRHRKKKKHPKYTQFDDRGIPTHDDNNQELSADETAKLTQLMAQRMEEVGSGTTVTELKGGEKAIQDASLMFRGLTVVK
jgi:tRNA wybutosine-synthesizing protein 1